MGPFYKFVLFNSTGVTILAGNLVVRVKRWRYISTGVVFEDSPATILISANDLANGSYTETTVQDNTDINTKWDGGLVEIKATPSGTANGNLEVYSHKSIDGTIYESNGDGDLIEVVSWISSSSLKYGIAKIDL